MKKKISGLVVCIICMLVLGACTGTEEHLEIIFDNPETTPVLPESPELIYNNPDEENLADMLQKEASGLMVQISAEGMMGSGVIYMTEEEHLVIVTAGHVLENAKGIVWVTFSDDFSIDTNQYIVSKNSDAAFILLPLSKIPAEHLAKYCFANVDKEGFDALKNGDNIIAMGSKSGVAKDAYEGKLLETWIYIEDFNQYMMLATVETFQGMSGGGLFDLQGHFIGILCGVNAEGEVAAIPLNILQAEYSVILQ